MTTNTEYNGNPRAELWPFALATFSAPLLIALCFFWVLLIPVFAILLGGVFYLIFGAPLAYLLLRAGQRSRVLFAVAGFMAVLMIVPAWPIIQWTGAYRARDLDMLLSFGLFFGPLWMAVLAHLYPRFAKEIPQIQQKG